MDDRNPRVSEMVSSASVMLTWALDSSSLNSAAFMGKAGGMYAAANM